MSNRKYIARIEARKDSNYADLENIVAAVEELGYQADVKTSSGAVEVYSA